MHKYVYLFKEGNASMRNLLGGKGSGLAEMTNIGVPIPQGFTITTEACTLYYDSGKTLPDYLIKEVYEAVKSIEKETGKKFGGDHNPLLVSVRSGARVSMPGMMDTILNLGLNDETVDVLAKETGNERFAYDSYRRFILMFTNIAKGHPRTDMDKMLEELKSSRGYKLEKLEIYVTQDIARAAQALDTIQVRFDAQPDKVYNAKIMEISKGTTRNNLSYLLTALLPNKEGKLLAGMSGKASLNAPSVSTLSQGAAIPQTALCHRSTEGDYLWVVNSKTQQVTKRKVKKGDLLPNGYVSITEGLYPDETVANSGLRFLSDGMKISVENE